MKINILGTNIDCIKSEDLQEKLKSFLLIPNSYQAGASKDQKHFLITPNPEIVLKAQVDKEYQNILNSADLAVPDGIGLKFASWFLHFKNIYRRSGVDTVLDLLKLANTYKKKILIVLHKKSLSNTSAVEKYILSNYPHIKSVAQTFGNKLTDDDKDFLVKYKPDIIFVALGAPWQEKWIYDTINLQEVHYNIAAGIGGTFDFFCGYVVRAPRILRRLGLEWLWRVVQEPRYRFKRIVNAVIVFPVKVIIYKFVTRGSA